MLTGLPNRQLFIDRLGQALANVAREETPLAVLFLVLDRFKEVNDTAGHLIGDRLLQEVAVRLQQCIRKNDTVARLGGDEFVILLVSIKDEKGATTVARKVVESLHKPFQLDDYRASISTSIGIALAPRDGSKTDLLLKRADEAMYTAKKAGRNCWRIFQETESTYERRDL